MQNGTPVMQKSLIQLVAQRRVARAAAFLIALFVGLSGYQQAEAQRARPARAERVAPARAERAPARARVQGAKVRSWKANGVEFQHETLRMNGKVVHWERRATRKSGTVSVRGKTWGSSYKGNEWQSGGKSFRKVTVKGTDGSRRRVFRVTEPNGTERTSIKGIPGVETRRITRWKLGNTVMTETRDFDAAGKLSSRARTGHKAK